MSSCWAYGLQIYSDLSIMGSPPALAVDRRKASVHRAEPSSRWPCPRAGRRRGPFGVRTAWPEQPPGPRKTSFRGRVRRFAPAASNRPGRVLNHWSVFSKAGPATSARMDEKKPRWRSTRAKKERAGYALVRRFVPRPHDATWFHVVQHSAPGEGKGRFRPGAAVDPQECPGY